MKHLSDGALRHYIDQPESLPDVQLHHMQQCDRCSAALALTQQDRVVTEAAVLTTPRQDLDIDAAWDRLQTSVRSDAQTASASTPSFDRPSWRSKVMNAPVLAAAGALLVVGGATAAAANDWLPIFHTESITPVSVNVDDLTQLPDLSSFGRWDLKTDPSLIGVADASAAASQTGLQVVTPTDLPTGVEGDPQYQVMDQQVATFTFSERKARAAAQAAGEPMPPLPSGLDGAVLRLELGPAVVQTWSQPSGVPTMVVAQVGAPMASSNGIPLETLRDALLSLPGLPDDVATELRAATGDGTTLPLPVPADQYMTASTGVNGTPATLITSRDQSLAGVVWLDGGVVTIVAGPLDSQEVLSVAHGLG